MELEKRQRRSASRKLQTFNKFNHEIAEALNLDRRVAVDLTAVILGNVVCRIGPQEATDFISQLPRKWQNVLLDLPVGPDRHIKAKSLLEEVKDAVDFTPLRALELVRLFWKTLGTMVSSSELEQVVGQLPKDLQHVLLPENEMAAFERKHGARVSAPLDVPFP